MNTARQWIERRQRWQALLEGALESQNMKTQITLLTLALFSLPALAADVTGTWKAEFETQRGLQKYTFTLKQDKA